MKIAPYLYMFIVCTYIRYVLSKALLNSRCLPINSLLNNRTGEGICDDDYRWWATPGNKNEPMLFGNSLAYIYSIYIHGFHGT